MELKKIEELLEKYFDSNSNEKEEQVLKNYFSQENVAKHLVQYQALFGFFAEAKQLKSNRILQLDTFKIQRKNRRFAMSVAASLIVAIGAGIFIYTNFSSSSNQDLGTFNDPKIALQETQKALSLLSKHVNTGYESVQVIDEYEITKNKIFNIN